MAIAKAVDECLDTGILTNFLEKNGKEVIKMFKLQWNEKDAEKFWKEEAHAQGKAEGKAEGEGNIVLNMLKGHMHLDVIEKLSGWTADNIRALAQKNGLAVE